MVISNSRITGELIVRVVNGKNLGHNVQGGDICVEITATTNDSMNFAPDVEMQKV